MITYLEIRAGTEIEVPSEILAQCLELFVVPGGPKSIHEAIEKAVSDKAKYAGVCGKDEAEIMV